MNEEIVVVLIEDNEDDQELARRALQRAGVRNKLVVLGDGAAALEFFAMAGQSGFAEPQRSYVILLDLKLPRVDGLDVLRALRQSPSTRSMPVVVLTSSDEERDLIESYEGGANSYIRKPVDFAQFSEVVKQLGFYWLALNLPAPAAVNQRQDDAARPPA